MAILEADCNFDSLTGTLTSKCQSVRNLRYYHVNLDRVLRDTVAFLIIITPFSQYHTGLDCFCPHSS